jgi:hypothetical protein
MMYDAFLRIASGNGIAQGGFFDFLLDRSVNLMALSYCNWQFEFSPILIYLPCNVIDLL